MPAAVVLAGRSALVAVAVAGAAGAWGALVVLAVVPRRCSTVCCASVVIAVLPQLVCVGALVRTVRIFDLFLQDLEEEL
eukprot:13670550-Alexandrium_andersonii.AAC.1